jgi:hypothetical protein
MRRNTKLTTIALAILTLAVGNLSALGQDSWPDVWPLPSEATQRIEAALEQPVSLDCLGLPLREVVETLAKAGDVPYRFDGEAMAQAGLSDDIALTHRFSDIPLASAFALVLGDLGLAYTIHNDALLITTPAGATLRAYVKVYDVAVLLRVTETADQLAGTLVASTEAPKQIYPPPTESERIRQAERRITPYQKLLLVRDTTPGHRDFSQVLRAMGLAFAAQNERLEREAREQAEQSAAEPPPESDEAQPAPEGAEQAN